LLRRRRTLGSGVSHWRPELEFFGTAGEGHLGQEDKNKTQTTPKDPSFNWAWDDEGWGNLFSMKNNTVWKGKKGRPRA